MEKRRGLVVALGVLGVILVMDTICKQFLHDTSAALSVCLQQTSTPFIDWLFQFLDSASLWLFLIIPLFSLATDGLKPGLGFFAIAAVSAGVSDLLKMMYADERPYWDYPNVLALECTRGWGHPSGHAQTTGSVYGLLAYYSYKRGRPILAFIIFLGILIVGYDRIYLGVHFYNHLLVGWAFAVVTIYLIQMGKLHKEENRWRVWVGSHCLIFAIITLMGVVYIFRDPRWKPRWTLAIHEVYIHRQKCGFDFGPKDVMFYAFYDSPILFLFPGFLTGLYAFSRLTLSAKDCASASACIKFFRFALNFALLMGVYLVSMGAERVSTAGVVMVTYGVAAYIGGALMAGVTQKLVAFSLENRDLSRRLVEE